MYKDESLNAQKRKNGATEDIIIRDNYQKKIIELKVQLENKEENYYKPRRIGIFYSNNYIEYDSNGDRNKTISIEKYLNKLRPYFKDIKINLKKPDTWKTQLAIAIKFMSSKDTDEECLMFSKSDNREIMTKVKMKLLKHFSITSFQISNSL